MNRLIFDVAIRPDADSRVSPKQTHRKQEYRGRRGIDHPHPVEPVHMRRGVQANTSGPSRRRRDRIGGVLTSAPNRAANTAMLHRGHCPRSLATPLAHSVASPQWPSQKRRRTCWSHTMRAIRSPPQRARLTCMACQGSGRRALRVSTTGAPTGAAARVCATGGVARTSACSSGSGR